MVILVVKVAIEEVSEGFVVPRHPEIAYEKSKDVQGWWAINTNTNQKVFVKKITKGKFCEYEMQYK